MAMALGDLTGISKVTPPLISRMARTPEPATGAADHSFPRRESGCALGRGLDREHRARGGTHHGLRVASQQDMAQARASVGAHDYQGDQHRYGLSTMNHS
jgi:hypothetical protein